MIVGLNTACPQGAFDAPTSQASLAKRCSQFRSRVGECLRRPIEYLMVKNHIRKLSAVEPDIRDLNIVLDKAIFFKDLKGVRSVIRYAAKRNLVAEALRGASHFHLISQGEENLEFNRKLLKAILESGGGPGLFSLSSLQPSEFQWTWFGKALECRNFALIEDFLRAAVELDCVDEVLDWQNPDGVPLYRVILSEADAQTIYQLFHTIGFIIGDACERSKA